LHADFDFITNFSAMWQVILGAFLATAGGSLTAQLEQRIEQNRRERNAALFFGEVLSTLKTVLRLADETKQIGDPFGQVTLRMLRSARREIDLYDRNRESLLDLRNARLRARIHTLMLRVAMPLDGIVDASQEIAQFEMQLRSKNLEAEDRAEIETHTAAIAERRVSGYDYMQESIALIEGILGDLGPLAHHIFGSNDDVVRMF
jgi:hypothetical protein